MSHSSARKFQNGNAVHELLFLLRAGAHNAGESLDTLRLANRRFDRVVPDEVLSGKLVHESTTTRQPNWAAGQPDGRDPNQDGFRVCSVAPG